MKEGVASVLERIRLLWDNLESMVKEGQSVITDDSPSILTLAPGARLGLDKRNRFHLLLALNEQNEKIRSRLTAGISIQTKTFEIDGIKERWVDITAERRWRFAIEPFSAEVILKMVDGTINLETLRNVVDEHRALWAAPKEPLSTSEQRGLIAELAVVMRLGGVIAPASAVSRWRGPDRGLHDIADEYFAIEVKAYAEEPPRVRINHIEQLDHRLDKRLTLVGVHLTGSEEGMSLPEFIDEALQWATDNDCRTTMEEQLAMARWKEEDRSEYHSRYNVGRMVICPIRPETPVFPAELKEKIPSSVSRISYLLHLNDIKHLPRDDESTWKMMTESSCWPSLED